MLYRVENDGTWTRIIYNTVAEGQYWIGQMHLAPLQDNSSPWDCYDGQMRHAPFTK